MARVLPRTVCTNCAAQGACGPPRGNRVEYGPMVAVRAWLFALLATLLVLLPSGGFARSEHYCRMSGRVVTSCCCDDAVAAATPSRSQQIQVEDCCQRISASTRSASLGLHRAVRPIAPAALVPAVPEPFAMPQSIGVAGQCAESTQAPLAIGPPLFVRHCALLS